MPGKVRRIVTGVNAAGRSFILSDTLLPTAPVIGLFGARNLVTYGLGVVFPAAEHKVGGGAR